MASLPQATVQEYITYGNICQFLAANEQNNQNNLFGGAINTNISRLLYIVKQAATFGYTNYPNTAGLGLASVFMYSLCGKYLGGAKRIIGSGTGYIVNPDTKAFTTIVAAGVQFTVGSVGSLMTAGQTVLTLSYSSVLSSSVVVELDGINLPQSVSGQISYAVQYNDTNIVITFNQGVNNGQLYIIRFLQYQNI